jgi:hypothetical protein
VDIFTYWLVRQRPNHEEQKLRVGANMMSWALYGDMQNSDPSEDAYIEQMMPFIKSGMQFE